MPSASATDDARHRTPPRARIGISGWRYAPWRGVFYPKGLQQRLELRYASDRLDSIELNGSFYSLQRPASYERWKQETPGDFVFAIKGPRYITHILRLRDSRVPLANFFASGVLALGEKLGPILWQLPQTLAFNPDELSTFLSLLPRTTKDAAELAAYHDTRLDGWAHLGAGTDMPLRHALEVRSASFDTLDAFALLRQHGVALVIADSAGKWPALREVTGDCVYLRLHGDVELYASGYTEAALARWAQDIRGWISGDSCPDGRGRDVFVYFDNDVKVRAPVDAMALRRLLQDVVARPEATAASTTDAAAGT
jgi:uncharacterized protein YecE (DUF72 family)